MIQHTPLYWNVRKIGHKGTSLDHDHDLYKACTLFLHVPYKYLCAIHPIFPKRNTVGIYVDSSVAAGAEAMCSRTAFYHR
jgi:hypothetical protein